MVASQARLGLGYGLASRWGWLVFRGVIGVLFGLIAFARPGAMAFSMVLVFGCYAFAGGIATVIAAARSGRAGEPRWGMLLVEGLLGIAVGALAVLWPGSTALAFVWAIGAWAIITGGLQIGTAVRLRRLIEHEWLLAIGGALSVALGVLMLYRPIAGGVAVVWWLGAYGFLFGILMITLGVRLRGIARSLQTGELPSEGLRQGG